MIEQLSIFMQNKEGHLSKVLRILSEDDINIQSLTISETGEYGIMRLIVSETEKAMAALKNSRVLCNITPVFAVSIPNRPGAMLQFVDLLSSKDLSIEYAYSYPSTNDAISVIVFKIDRKKWTNVEELLQNFENASLLDQKGLSKL